MVWGDGSQHQFRLNVQRRYDPERPGLVDDILPTRSVKLQLANRKGIFRAPRGTAIGSYRITGSFREAATAGAPGTYSLRITRVSVFAGTPNQEFYVRHSREGTVDVIFLPSAGQEVLLGDHLRPIYSFGPGTVTYGFTSAGSGYDLGAHMEGFVG